MVAVPTEQHNDLPFPANKYVRASQKWLGKTLIVNPSIMSVIKDRIKGTDVLDVGCGDGRFALQLSEMGANKVVGIDNNHEMILQCKSKYHLHSNLKFREESSFELSDEDEYDFAFAIFVLQFSANVAELQKSLNNIARALKPGGEFIGFMPNGVGDLNPTKANGIKFGASIVLHTYPPVDGEKIKVEFFDDQGNVIGDSPITFFYRSTYEHCLKEAGFTEIEWIDPKVCEEGLSKYGEEFFSTYFNPPKDVIVKAKLPTKETA